MRFGGTVFIFFLLSQLFMLQGYATPISRKAVLVAQTGDPLPVDGSVSAFLKKHEQEIYQNLAAVWKKTILKETIQIAPEQEENGNSTKEVGIEDIEFLWEHAVIEAVDWEKNNKIVVPGDMPVFGAGVPVVLKGTSYRVMDGKIIVRIDQRKIPTPKEAGVFREERIEGNRQIVEQRIVEVSGGDGKVIPMGSVIERPVEAVQIRLYVDVLGNIYYRLIVSNKLCKFVQRHIAPTGI